MFNEFTDIFKDVYLLANKRREDYERYGLSEISMNESGMKKYEEYQQSDNKRIVDASEQELERYLLSLDFELIKIIQSIMYLGRDEDYYLEDSSEQRYLKKRQALELGMGWNTIKVEINQMVEKVPFDKYLLNGFKILGIQI